MWRRWGTPQNFLLPFIDELWKTWKIRLLKKWNILLEISLYTCTKKHNDMRYSSWDTKCDKIFCHFGHFLPCYPLPPNNPENQNFEKMKKTSGDVIILNLHNKKHDYMIYAYSDMECDRHNCHFRPFFPLLPHYWPRKLKFGKNVKKNWIYYPFTHVHHKSRSYDVWFLRYKMQRTKFLSFWTIFCPLTLPTTQKIKVLKDKKRAWRYYHFTLVYHIWRSYDVWFLTYQVQQTYFFYHFWLFIVLLPP